MLNTKYIIFSDIDDTLYTNIAMTKKVEHTHNLIHLIKNKHLVFLSARPNIWFIKYLTKWRLKHDFDNFVLLIGSFLPVMRYLMFFTLNLLSFGHAFNNSLQKSRECIGEHKIDQFNNYIKINHQNIFSQTDRNMIIFLGDNLQGDEYIGKYIGDQMNGYIAYDNNVYNISSLVFIRDAAKKHIFDNCSHVMPYQKNMYITDSRCDVNDLIILAKN